MSDPRENDRGLEGDRGSGDDRGAGDDLEAAPPPRPSSRRFALLLVVLVAAWNAYQAFAAPSMREAVAPTLFVAGAAGLGIAAAGPERLKIVAFFVGAALCLAAFATEV